MTLLLLDRLLTYWIGGNSCLPWVLDMGAAMSWLVVKEDCFDEACSLFPGTSLRVTTEGHPYLGAL